MSLKRSIGLFKHAPAKRARSDAPIDPVTGQMSVLPAINDGASDASDEDTRAVQEYMRSVRSEANALPTLLQGRLATQERREKLSAENNPSVVYSDGVFVRRDVPDSDYESDIDAMVEDDNDGGLPRRMIPAADRYHELVLFYFQRLRAFIAQPAPASVLQSRDRKTHPHRIRTDIPAEDEADTWARQLIDTAPTPAQIASMDEDTIIQLLHFSPWILTNRYHQWRSFPARIDNLACWLRSLLARLDDVGSLQAEHVSVVRDIGKAAVRVTVIATSPDETQHLAFKTEHGLAPYQGPWEDSIDLERTRKMARLRYKQKKLARDAQYADDADSIDLEIDSHSAQPDDEDANTDAEEESTTTETETNSAALQAEKDRLLAMLSKQQQDGDDASPTNTDSPDDLDATRPAVVMLADALLTIVGEAFGQRDLLDARKILWPVARE